MILFRDAPNLATFPAKYKTCLSCQSSFLSASSRQQQVPHHHLVANLVIDHDKQRCQSNTHKKHLDSEQYWSKLVAVRCLAVHVHIDRDQEQEAFKVALQEQESDVQAGH